MNKIFLTPVRCFTFLLALVFSNAAFSQDDIIMRNDDVIKGKVEEVGVNLIKYRKADNMDGPLYDMPKSDVYMIVYNNGSRDVINPRGDGQQTNVVAEAPVRVAPPEMPVYEQPACPVEGYLWTPGYWAYGPGGYYWVPGVWVNPPRPGFLWTPCYWGYENGYYGFHEGYWGEHIGFYGGINYGYGYGGYGYEGGRWEGGSFRYNTAVSRVDVTVVHTTYVDRTVVNNTTVVSHASFNGEGGVRVQPTPQQQAVAHENHVKPTVEQQSHVSVAKSDQSQYVSANNGHPTVVAMNKPNGQHFSSEGHQVVAHPGTQPNISHPVNEQHTAQPAQQHTSEPANHNTFEQHNNTPATQHTAEPVQQHGATPGPQHTSEPVQQHNMEPAQHSNTAPSQQHNNTSLQQHNNTPAKAAPVKPAPAPAKKK